MRRLFLVCLLALLPLSAGAAFDHQHGAWTALLQKHVVLVDGGKASQVNYAGFARDRAALKAYLDGLSAVTSAEFDAWARPQRLAFLINAYNAFTVELILTRYPELKSIRDLGNPVFNSPWKQRFFALLGEKRHLDWIEHEVIRRPGAYDEPRIHFAVNCASVGCPMLREEAFVAERLDAQLEEQTRRFLADRSRNRYNPASGKLEVSAIFKWYGKDFESGYGGIASLPQFFGKYADLLADAPAERARIREGRAPLAYTEYAWALNDTRG